MPIPEFLSDIDAMDDIREPPMYKVIILNDDYTPMDFVVRVLEEIFNKTPQEAVEIMLAVHKAGAGVCGVYAFEVAETKAAQVCALARKNGHPLRCVIEEE